MNVFQSDDGGEFVSEKISSHFIAEGVIHQFSRPYTPQQSGLIERRHRLIVEIGLAQLFHSSVSLDFWVESFSAAVYVMN